MDLSGEMWKLLWNSGKTGSKQNNNVAPSPEDLGIEDAGTSQSVIVYGVICK